jgi:hypothetical protein
VPLVAIALFTVAPIHGEGQPLSAIEVRERLYGSRRPSLDGLKMRREKNPRRCARECADHPPQRGAPLGEARADCPLEAAASTGLTL